MGFFSVDGKLAKLLNRLGNLLLLNMLTVICSIPVFTFGAAMTALYTCTLRLVRGEDGSLAASFFAAFRGNFKQATKVWLLGGGIIVFMAFDIWLLNFLEGTFSQVYRIVLFVLILLAVLELVYTFALMARFQNSIRNTLKNALILLVGNPIPTVLLLNLMAIPVAFLMISYRLVAVDILLGISGPVYLSSIYFTYLFKRFEGV